MLVKPELMDSPYYSYFTSLHTAKIAGKNAPHKAVLLLAIMDLVEAGIIDSRRIELSEKLESAFGRAWKRYIGTSLIFTPKVATPYWHMQTEPFYRLYMNDGQLINGGTGRYSIKWLRENTYALIDEQLFHLMQMDSARAELRVALISMYFQGLHLDDVLIKALSVLGILFYAAA